VEQQYAEIEKEKLHGFSSTGVPTKQESKLGILEYTYTPAMPSTERERERERETLKLLGCESGGFCVMGFRRKRKRSSDMRGDWVDFLKKEESI
jgi:hypothetical protein